MYIVSEYLAWLVCILYQTPGGEICSVAGDELMKDYQRVTLYSDIKTDIFSAILYVNM